MISFEEKLDECLKEITSNSNIIPLMDFLKDDLS